MKTVQYPLSMKIIFKEEELKAQADPNGCKSEEFDCFPGIRYYLCCYPNGISYAPIKTGIFLHLIGIKNEIVLGDYTISIPSANFSLKSTVRFVGSLGCGVYICEKNELYNPEKRFFVDGKMTVRVDGILTFIIPPSCHFSWGSKDDSIGQKLWNQDDKDFTFVVETEKIKVHKCVLAASSPVFYRMLQNEWKEVKDNEVKIPDFDLKIVTKALQFCYDIPLKNLACKEAIDLIKFADKYDIKKVHNKIQEYLAFKLSTANICEIANGSLLGNATKLRKSCFEFLQKCLKEKSPIGNIASLDPNLAKEFFIDALS